MKIDEIKKFVLKIKSFDLFPFGIDGEHDKGAWWGF